METQNGATSLLIVEEHDLLRQGLESVFESETEFEIVGSLTDPGEAIDKACLLHPQVVVFGLRDQEQSTLFCATLSKREPDVKILLLVPPGSEEMLADVFKKGASGCLFTDIMAEDLIQTIKMLAKGQMVLPQAMAYKGVVERRNRHRNLPNLTIRELEVLQLMANGLRNREIAEGLCLSVVTVKTHVSHILRKLGKSNRTAAILHAHLQGWIDLTL